MQLSSAEKALAEKAPESSNLAYCNDDENTGSSARVTQLIGSKSDEGSAMASSSPLLFKRLTMPEKAPAKKASESPNPAHCNDDENTGSSASVTQLTGSESDEGSAMASLSPLLYKRLTMS